MIRTGGSSPRSPVPPSAFPTTLQPTASRESSSAGGGSEGAGAGVVHRRGSRTEMDFEQALRGGGTVLIREGLDMNALGHDPASTPSPLHPAHSSLRSTPVIQPSTPTIVPPTPTPTPGAGAKNRPSSPSVSSSSNDLFFDAEDAEHQTRRRSMYRSPGTASSPDLATLVRKAKQRGGVLQSHFLDRIRHEPPPPLPTSPHTPVPRIRQHSTASSGKASPLPASPLPIPARGRNKLQKTPSTSTMAESINTTAEWVLTSPKSGADSGTVKGAKSSVRAKTSAFLGKMLGQGSVRERSKTDAAYSPPEFFATAPPVPPLPKSVRSSAISPVADVFANPAPSPVATHSTSSSANKPLPPINRDDDKSDKGVNFDDQSLVVVERSPRARTRSRSPDKTVRYRSDTIVKLQGHNKRRSMSVGEIELKKAMSASSSTTPLPAKDAKAYDLPLWDSSMHGILSDLEGQLSQLDPISANPLDLHVPSTPPKRPAQARARAADDHHIPSTLRPGVRATSQQHTSPASTPLHQYSLTPIVTLDPASRADDTRSISSHTHAVSVESAVIPPRMSSLTTPNRGRSGSNPLGPRPLPSAFNSRGLGPRNLSSSSNLSSSGAHAHTSSRDSSRLWVQPRGTAFSSEPSLIPSKDVSAPLSAVSQQDLTSGTLGLRRFPSAATSEDMGDIEAKGKERAARCWEEDEDFLAKEKIAEWLGGVGHVNKAALHHYIDYFDFSGLRLDLAFRRLCAKLYLKAETQQVDRILEEFSRRYWDCNPGSLFGTVGVVHAVSYSLLLLNTDLHVAELSTRMSKGQFARNTLAAIQIQLRPDRSQQGSTSDLTYDDSSSVRGASEGSDVGTSTLRTRSKRSDSITSWNSITREAVISNLGTSLVGSAGAHYASANGSSSRAGSTNQLTNDSTASVSNTSNAESKTPSTLVSSVVYDRNWENDMESLLKDMYTAIKNQQVLQPLGSLARASTSSPANGHVSRNRSLRTQPDRLTTLKRGSIRGLQSILGAQQQGASPYSSNSSIDGRASPSPSFATSTHEGMHGSTLAFLTPTLGFASNLSHTIIREAQEDDDRSHDSHDSESTTISITDEELALLGPPWAKEGMLCRKQYNESLGKRAKSKTWMDVFVVIQKGELSMFTFGDHAAGGNGVVGGGNWLENAQMVGTVNLAHSLSHALPPPGYNRQRPHCMVLTLSQGAVYFFQAGTEELVNEWVSTCNYWAARQSKEPLTGGVSNMEYGWNRVNESLAHGRSVSDDESMRMADLADNMSVRSGRSSRSKFGRKDGSATVRLGNSPWADRTFINDWKPPNPPSVASTHDEETQLDALRKHVTSLTTDLQRHNELRAPMMALYPARSANAAKALSNWEHKSQHVLAEIVKYESYIDSLQSAMALRLKKRGEKALERALHGDDGAYEGSKGKKWKGHPDAETIMEGDEPPSSGGGGLHSRSRTQTQLRHRREVAEAYEDAED